MPKLIIISPKLFLRLDAYPTSTCGKIVAVFALLCGVLVIAFPVSIFSELWSKELRAMGELRNLYDLSDPDEDYEEDDDDDISYQSSEQRAPVKFVSTRSTHDLYENQSEFPDVNTSFASMLLQNHDDLSQNSNNSLVQTGQKNNQNDDRLNDESDSEFSSHAEFTTKDIADLRRYVESIEHAQTKIRKILTKFEPG